MRLTTRPALLAEALGDDMQVDQSTSRIILVLARQETQVLRKQSEASTQEISGKTRFTQTFTSS